MTRHHQNIAVTYVGLDVSLAKTNICVLDAEGKKLFEGEAASDPQALFDAIKTHAPYCAKVGLETGATTPWLWRELKARGLPVVCLDARHANKALSMRRNKTDKNDAFGLAELMRIGWYKEAQVRSLDAQYIRSMLAARYQLRMIRRQVLNQMRAIVKTFGLFSGSTATRTFPEIVSGIARDNPSFAPLLRPLLDTHESLMRQIVKYDAALHEIVKADEHARRLTTIPGVSDLVALGFMSAIDDPRRFSSSEKVGPYLGLAPRLRQSGESSWSAGIGPAPDKMVRSYLYQAAGVIITKTQKWSKLKAWGVRLYKRIGFKRAAIAVARKLAIIMHAIWVDGTEFEFGGKTKGQPA